jgi:hypothetical protein
MTRPTITLTREHVAERLYDVACQPALLHDPGCPIPWSKAPELIHASYFRMADFVLALLATAQPQPAAGEQEAAEGARSIQLAAREAQVSALVEALRDAFSCAKTQHESNPKSDGYRASDNSPPGSLFYDLDRILADFAAFAAERDERIRSEARDSVVVTEHSSFKAAVQACENAHNRAAALAAAGNGLAEAIGAVLKEPYGCAWCDSGTLRKPGIPGKEHDDQCPYRLLHAALAAWLALVPKE